MSTHRSSARARRRSRVRAAARRGVPRRASRSFPGMIPGLWAIVDNSPSTTISVLSFAAHIFRMSLFFFVAGFFARMMFHREGRARLLARSRQAHPAAARRRLDRPLPDDRGGLDLGADEDLRRQLPPPPANMPAPPPGAFPLTHLWFLYYLLVLYVIVLIVRCGDRRDSIATARSVAPPTR